MEVYVARQPIFDKYKEIYGYELLFRSSMDNYFPDIDGNTATSKLLNNTFFNIGVEQLTGEGMAFVNFTQDLLLKNGTYQLLLGHIKKVKNLTCRQNLTALLNVRK